MPSSPHSVGSLFSSSSSSAAAAAAPSSPFLEPAAPATSSRATVDYGCIDGGLQLGAQMGVLPARFTVEMQDVVWQLDSVDMTRRPTIAKRSSIMLRPPTLEEFQTDVYIGPAFTQAS